MDGRWCGAYNEVSDGKVSVLRLKEVMRTRSIKATTYVYMRMYVVWFRKVITYGSIASSRCGLYYGFSASFVMPLGSLMWVLMSFQRPDS